MPSANMLGESTSPYLLQHRDNPVHWRPWGPAALDEARRSGRPILLSIGYAACHWCHVMAHESFEDPETAALMNTRFVSIKVDREERPDIDHLYMTALHAFGEQGGWPLTMFLLPDGRPFWGGTYFPPEPRWGRPSFRQVLTSVADAVASGDVAVARNAEAVAGSLARAARANPGDGIAPADIAAVRAALLGLVDPAGGLRGAPKFPNPTIFRLLAQTDFLFNETGGRDAARGLLTAMSLGGIHDHLGGGYARYSTDAEWLAPHFEKMLYDNALLLDLLALAHADRPDALFAERAEELVGWLRRDMAVPTPRGTVHASSEDADSEGEEGRFYVWDAGEVRRLLDTDFPAFAAAYDVTAAGNWEGKTILRRVTQHGDAAAERRLAAARERLLAVRAARVRPGRDDKVLTDWNALLIAALARAAAVFDRPDWLAMARDAYAGLTALMAGPDGLVAHAWRDGRIGARGLLEDHAALARAALALHEATGERGYLLDAERLATVADAHFGDTGAYFGTARDADDVPLGDAARYRPAADNATPAGNGLMAEVLARLFHLTGEERWRDRAFDVSRAFSGERRLLAGMPTLLAAADLLERGKTVVVVGDIGSALGKTLLRAALTSPDPATVVTRGGEALSKSHPAHGKPPGPRGASAYVCQNQTCSSPLDNPEALAKRLRGAARD